MCVFLLTLGSAAAMEPPGIEWTAIYGSYFRDARGTSNGDIIVAGRRWYNYARTLFLYSQDGELLWEASVYPENTGSVAVVETPDGGFVATGSGIPDEGTTQYGLSLYKVSADGDALWSRLYHFSADSRASGNDLVLLPDGGFAICGRIDPYEGKDQAWILRTDAQGDTLWTREWGWTYNDNPVGVLHLDNGITVFINGRLQNTTGGPHMIRYDMEGNLLWEKYVEFPSSGGSPMAQDFCFATGIGGFYLLIENTINPSVVHTDHEGNVIWYSQSPFFHEPATDDYYEHDRLRISSTMDGGYIYCGHYYREIGPGSPYDWYGWIYRRDSLGEGVWADYISSVQGNYCDTIQRVTQLPQGGYVAVGDVSTSSGQQGCLIRYSPELGIETPDSEEFRISGVSPNPATVSTMIEYHSPLNGIVSLTVYDLSGRVADRVYTGHCAAGSNSVEWSVPGHLEPGCYFLRLNSDTEMSSARVILLN